ncbi:MAG: LysM peptidoglycan-binding domain-containing protein [Lachnospiraceae bacterium]|nr:LysM peptidoglycan-binding domain-containing protein [Lachnospiraceae bacterium]
MQLPKNITQIGEIDRDCKIYVEDYVVSYIKQLNGLAEDKDIAVSLYGRHEEENGTNYCFVYGACKLDFLQKEVRHLSQAQSQEIEKWRRKYFPELDFLGYRILNGEMIEGFHICEQDICRYVSGYAQFYEKNDAMLAYMLEVREESKPEQVDRQKYEEVKQRQEERRNNAEVIPLASLGGKVVPISARLQKMRLASVGVFALLCLFGIAAFRERVDENAYDAYASTAVGGSAVTASEDKDVLVMEDKLEAALRGENESAGNAETAETNENSEEASAKSAEMTGGLGEASAESAEANNSEKTSDESAEMTGGSGETAAESAEANNSGEASEESAAANGSAEASAPAETAIQSGPYVIQPGDTLLAISKRRYGTTGKVSDICKANKISDPDDIKEGQVITLP